MTPTRATPKRAISAAPNAEALAALSAPAETRRLTKATPSDPVLGASVPSPNPAESEPPITQGPPPAPVEAKVKASFYIEASQLKRARAAYSNLPASRRPRSFSDFQAAAVMASVEAVEQEINGGAVFPGIEAGTLPTGRPLQL